MEKMAARRAASALASQATSLWRTLERQEERAGLCVGVFLNVYL